MRFHTQTSGASLTWQQPYNNIVRTALEALAAVLGGTQSLHTNSYDEAWALPTEHAVAGGAPDPADNRRGDWRHQRHGSPRGVVHVEWLTDKLEEEAYRYFDRIERAGGILEAIKSGYLQREIAENAYRLSKRVESGEDGIVGVNKYTAKEETPISTLKIDMKAQRRQIERITKVKAERDNRKVKSLLEKLQKAYENPDANSMYPLHGRGRSLRHARRDRQRRQRGFRYLQRASDPLVSLA